MDSQCMYQIEATYLQPQPFPKGNGRWDSDWFIACYAQNTPITH